MSQVIQPSTNIEIQKTNPNFVWNVLDSLQGVPISKQDIEAEREATKQRTHNILGSHANYMLDVREVIIEKLKASLDNMEFPRQIDFHDIESALSHIKDFLEKQWHSFKKLDYPNELWDKNEFDTVFARPIIQSILDRYLGSFWHVGDLSWKVKSKKMVKNKSLRQLPPKLANILNNSILEEMLLMLTRKNMIQVSDNIGNTFSKELEQKILRVDKEKLIQQLEATPGIEKRFEGIVTDTYYDFPDNRLENKDPKSTFRIRKKESIDGEVKYFYTVKRKDKRNTTLTGIRECWEEEFEITQTDVHHIQSILKDFGMYEFKSMSKYRVSYHDKKRKVKFDIDDYKWLDTLLEIEAEKIPDIEEYRKHFWLEENETFDWGKTSLMKRKEIDYPKYALRK